MTATEILTRANHILATNPRPIAVAYCNCAIIDAYSARETKFDDARYDYIDAAGRNLRNAERMGQ